MSQRNCDESVLVVTASKSPEADLSRSQGHSDFRIWDDAVLLSIPEVFTQQDAMMVVCAVI